MADVARSKFVQFWNNIMVPKFVKFKHILVDGLSFHATKHFENNAVVKPNEIVLEIGCGFGDDTVRLGKVAKHVHAIDCCDKFVEFSSDFCKENNVKNVSFEVGDAGKIKFECKYDVIYSRFSTMFFERPVPAFRNLASALVDDGRVFFVTWGPRDRNNFLTEPVTWIAPLLPPKESVETCGPGPFSQTTERILTDMLGAAGLTDCEFDWTDGNVLVGSSVEEAIEFSLAMGPLGEKIREAGDFAKEHDEEIRQCLRDNFKKFTNEKGEVWMNMCSLRTIAYKRTKST